MTPGRNASGRRKALYVDNGSTYSGDCLRIFCSRLDIRLVHAEPYEDTPDPADGLVHEVSIAFWDRYLRDDETGTGRIRSAVRDAGSLASLDEK